MPAGEAYALGQNAHDWFAVNLMAGGESDYHNIELSKGANVGPGGHPLNVWITRNSGTYNNTWTVEVGKGDPQFLLAEEYYNEATSGKRPSAWYSTLFQGGYFHFTFDLIKN